MMRSILTYLFIFIMVLLAASCGSVGPSTSNTKPTGTKGDTIRIVNDSLEYEIIIIELGFNSWLATQPPRGYRSLSSMDLSNDFKVPEYNIRVNNPLRYGPDLYPFRIDYDRSVDYGYEVTYL